MHRDIVTIAPPSARVFGSNDNCACQALLMPGRVLSVQGLNFHSVLIVRSSRVQPTYRGIPIEEAIRKWLVLERRI
jgi:hypothetical protein